MGRKAIPSGGGCSLPTLSLSLTRGGLILTALTLALGLAVAPQARAEPERGQYSVPLVEGFEWFYSHNGEDRCFADGYRGETRKAAIEAPVGARRWDGLSVTYFPWPRHREFHGASFPGRHNGDTPRRHDDVGGGRYSYDFDVYILRPGHNWWSPLASRWNLVVTPDGWYGQPKAIELGPLVRKISTTIEFPFGLRLAYWAKVNDGSNDPSAKRDRMIEIPIRSIWEAARTVAKCAKDNSVLMSGSPGNVVKLP